MPTHQLIETDDNRFDCLVCGLTWKRQPTSDCVGVPIFRWAAWPEHLLTKKQMGEAGFQTGKKLPAPAGACFREKSPDGVMWLYNRNMGVPKKVMSPEERQRLKAAAKKAQAEWYCTRCNQPHGYISSRGYWRSYRVSPPGLCDRCSDRDRAIEWAQGILALNPLALILDTETTGLSASYNEIIHIAVIDTTGAVLLDTFVKPLYPYRMFERGGGDGLCAHDIHGIDPSRLESAPSWPEVWDKLAGILKGLEVVIYNAAFDEQMIVGDCQRHGLQGAPIDAQCAMEWYAQYVGDVRRDGSYRWQALNGGHDAAGDCQAVLALLKGMAGVEVQA